MQKKIKLSVLIPVFNWKIEPLIDKLVEQVVDGDFADEVEICVVDDCSNLVIYDQNLVVINNGIKSGVDIKYFRNENNLGRSKTRNILLENSEAEYCLFLDSDVLPDSEHFLKKYIHVLNYKSVDVVCGGVSYDQISVVKESEKFYLKQGKMLSVASEDIRNLNPWKWIFTSNVLVSRAVLKKVPFNDTYTVYGYEDVEWAIRLNSNNVIVHIDNSVTHLGLLSDRVYYDKMQQSTINLIKLVRQYPLESSHIKVVRAVMIAKFLPEILLQIFSSILGFVYFKSKNFTLKNFCFQLSKCCFAAIEIKRWNLKEKFINFNG